jgi:large repetitive protein
MITDSLIGRSALFTRTQSDQRAPTPEPWRTILRRPIAIVWLLTLACLASSPAVAQITITTSSSLPAGQVGVPYSVTLQATGGVAPYTWQLSEGTLPSGLALHANGTVSGTPQETGPFLFVASVEDDASNTRAKHFSFTIGGMSITSSSPLPAATVGVPYGFTFAVVGGEAPHSWEMSSSSSPPGLSMQGGGTLSGTPTLAGDFNFLVTVSENLGTETSRSYSMTVNPATLKIVTPSQLPNARRSDFYHVRLMASGGYPPYEWKLTSGEPPSGLSLSADGVVSGKPGELGVFQFQAQVRDQHGATEKRTFTLTVAEVFRIKTSSPLPDGKTGEPYSLTMDSSGGTGQETWRIASGELPPGLSLRTDGLLLGTPTATGAHDFIIQVMDEAFRFAEKPFTLTVVSSAPVLSITTPAELPAATLGASYSVTLAAEGGVPPYKWAFESGALPDGLSLDSDTGVLSGTPERTGEFRLQIDVTDVGGESAARVFELNVELPSLAISTTSPLPGGYVGEPYSAEFAAANGTIPYTWSLSGGTLPPGLTFRTDGALTGVPSQIGEYSFDVTVLDNEGATASRGFSLAVALLPLTITTGSPLPEGFVGEPYDLGFAAVGAVAPYSWSHVGGSLPPGLVLSADGLLRGVPTTAGSSTFAVRVADANGDFVDNTFRLMVVLRPLQITSSPELPEGAVGQPYAELLQATGGVAPYRWTPAQGETPPGLMLSGSGELSGLPEAPGNYAFQIRLTDAASSTIEQGFTLRITGPPLPSFSIEGLPGESEPATPQTFRLMTSEPYLVDLSGEVWLEFNSDVGWPVEDPAVQFSSGGRTARFTVAAGSTIAIFTGSDSLGIQTGSVAGRIMVTAVHGAGAGGVVRSQELHVLRSAPIASSGVVVRGTAGFEVRILGLTSTCEVISARFQFAGSNVQTTSVVVAMDEVFKAWMGSDQSNGYGGTFAYTQPFTLEGNMNSVTGVTVTLLNSVGESVPLVIPF